MSLRRDALPRVQVLRPPSGIRIVNETPDQEEKATAAVPLFGTWRRAYIAVVVAFVLEVSLFYFVSRFFS